MAKRKSEVKTRQWGCGMRHYDVWIDNDMLPCLQNIDGIQKVSALQNCGAPYWIALDPRYDASEVIAEIEALGKPVVQPWKPSLRDRAEALGRDATAAQRTFRTMELYLDSACGGDEAKLWKAFGVLFRRLRFGHW